MVCVELAQCGAVPLVKLANDLGIEWHLFVDGDAAGRQYADRVRPHLDGRSEEDHITLLRERDLEHHLWKHGYAGVYRRAAGGAAERRRQGDRRRDTPARVIEKAVRKRSKPALALAVVRAADEQASAGVPPAIGKAIDAVVRLARETAP